MSSQVQVVRPDDTIETCMEMMTAHRVRHLPVCDGPSVVGLVSIGDVVKGLLDEQRFVIQQLEQYVTK
jgi:IMP dehydrogenase